LQAQLQQFQQQLSDTVNCSSAKTPEGKAQIQAISTKISQVKAHIDQSKQASSSTPAPTHAKAASPAQAQQTQQAGAPGASPANGLAASPGSPASPAPTTTSIYDTVGSRVNTTA
jgi:hypothetical protein